MGHTARVSRYSCGIARHMGFNEKRLERLRIAADLHDIGKIGIKEGIINKTGKLTDTEYHTIQDHVTMGEKILQPITFLQDVLPFIRGHHEKWDGTGYPDGLKGDACPLEGRIIALADAFDAMTSQRSYNKPLTFSQAWERISEARGRHFDPDVVDAFGYFLDQTLYAEEEARKQGHDRPTDTKGEVAKATKVTFADPKTSS
jgi:putative nucleotidyltransferase with HDIG domain